MWFAHRPCARVSAIARAKTEPETPRVRVFLCCPFVPPASRRHKARARATSSPGPACRRWEHVRWVHPGWSWPVALRGAFLARASLSSTVRPFAMPLRRWSAA